MVNNMYYTNVFFIFSIIGHFIENFFYTSKDSGILYGYWTPIYGIGVVVIIACYNFIDKKFKLNKFLKFILIFLASSILLSFIELIGGILVEKVLRITFWDYSKEKFSIFRYTSLKMALLWGVSSWIVVYIIKPIIDKLVKYIPKYITYIFIVLFSIDSFITLLPYLTK